MLGDNGYDKYTERNSITVYKVGIASFIYESNTLKTPSIHTHWYLPISHLNRKQRVRGVNDESIQHVHCESIGQQWVQCFLRRHSKLLSVNIRNIDVVRVRDTLLERLSCGFENL